MDGSTADISPKCSTLELLCFGVLSISNSYSSVLVSGAENKAACSVRKQLSTWQQHVTASKKNTPILHKKKKKRGFTFTLVPGKNLPPGFDNGFQNLKCIIL